MDAKLKELRQKLEKQGQINQELQNQNQDLGKKSWRNKCYYRKPRSILACGFIVNKYMYRYSSGKIRGHCIFYNQHLYESDNLSMPVSV